MTNFLFTSGVVQAFDGFTDILIFEDNSANEVVVTTSGSNTIFTTSAGSDTVYSGRGNDSITLSGGNNTVVYSSAAIGSNDLAINVIDIITGFVQGTSDVLNFSGAAALLLAGGGSAGAGGTLAAMTDATTFASGTANAIEYYDDGTDLYITLNVGGDTTYTSAGDTTIKLVGMTGGTAGFAHTGITLTTEGVLSVGTDG